MAKKRSSAKKATSGKKVRKVSVKRRTKAATVVKKY